jgi:integral membrane protein
VLSDPQRLFRSVAIAEAITWALLLTGMFLKYVTSTTELGVRVFGMVHGVVFVAYCLTTVLVAVDQRWSVGRTLLGLLAAVPPFFTLLFDRYAERRGALADRWRLTSSEPLRGMDRPVSWLLRNPVRGVVAGLVAVAALTGVALLVGPPAG